MKKILLAILVAVLLLMLVACGDKEKEDPDTEKGSVISTGVSSDNAIEILIREGNTLYQNGEKEAADLIFARVAKLLNAKANSPEELLAAVNLDEKLSDTAKEMLAAYYMIEYDGEEEKPSLPEGYDWGDE